MIPKCFREINKVVKVIVDDESMIYLYVCESYSAL
jgi:hypothetical protein